MAVTRKPRVVPENEIEALIAKGGSVATPAPAPYRRRRQDGPRAH